MPITSVRTEQVEEILGQYEDAPANLIPILQEIQGTYYYLPQSALRRVSQKLEVSLSEVYHVATFYNCFSLVPVGSHILQVCLGTACHVRGGPQVLDRILRDLKLPEPGTTKDFTFTVRTVRCFGCCGLAPVVRVDNRIHHHLTQAKVSAMLKLYRPKLEADGEQVSSNETKENAQATLSPGTD